jgi:hypothetical protein
MDAPAGPGLRIGRPGRRARPGRSRRRAHRPRRPPRPVRAGPARRCVLGVEPTAGVLDPGARLLRPVLLPGPATDGRLHPGLPARPRSGEHAAPGRGPAPLRVRPHRRSLRPDPGPGRRAAGRRRRATPSPHGPGGGRRRRRVLESAPGRRPARHGGRRADPPLPDTGVGAEPAEDRHPRDLHGRLRRAADRREVPHPGHGRGRHQSGHLDVLRPGPRRQRRRVRLGGGVRQQRRRDPRRGAVGYRGAAGVGEQRPLPPRRGGHGQGVVTRCRRRAVPGVPHLST